MSTTSPIKDEGAGARDASPLKHDLQHLDSADITADVKRHATLAAKLALAGYSLHRMADGKYTVAAWNLALNVEGLDGIEQFLRRLAP